MDVSIDTLFECVAEDCPVLPLPLCAAYGGDLRFPRPSRRRPYLVANFVSTIDGVISFDIPGKSGGSAISGANPGDRLIMGLLRASADVVLVGSGTVSAVSYDHLWIAEYIFPEAAELYAKYRQELRGRTTHPLIAIVSGTGRIDLGRAVFHRPDITVLVLTTEAGRRRLTGDELKALPSTVVRALPASGGMLPSLEILRVLKQDFGANFVLHEGGPTLFGQCLADRAVDELFLTIAPQVAGRVSERPRPALLTNTEFLPGNAPWLDLLSVKRAGNHLYVRYRVTTAEG